MGAIRKWKMENGKERKGKERKGKERKGKERKGKGTACDEHSETILTSLLCARRLTALFCTLLTSELGL